MSRALDPGITSSISTETFQKIYADIVQALCQETGTLLEIEFLGKSHPLPPDSNVLVDENYIAVSKVKLVQAFVVGRRILLRYLKDCPKEKILELQNATAVILLMDPEHLTAANTRKRLIQLFQDGPEAELKAALKKEFLFVDSYLTSRLHRHTKSPTLWSHRRWLLEVSASLHLKHDILRDLEDVILVAAERHPKNYYAWSHMRWLTHTCSTESSSVNELPQIITVVKNWCLRHPGDTSGFSFLLFGLSHSKFANLGDSDISNTCSAVCTDVLRLAVSFKWTHESVWVFLRTAVAGYGTEADRAMFYAAIEDISKASPEGHKVLTRARDWCMQYEQKSGLGP
ncbi:uncharacterized protein PAC_09528 [Phialocephala subalpina]|uniref:Uncharacterized protein n=1 Tax=Phialocephala subalpina TaxID=576137 RepID=A0A1L7X3N2_9HELO|nr:uncharacterized protein PAC_09528 [Phialocephala subalpina]